MKEWIYGRNPVYEVLRAGRRQVNRMWVAQGIEQKGNLVSAIKLARKRGVVVENPPRRQFDRFGKNNQGVAIETNEYQYSELADIFTAAERTGRQPFILILDALQDPQNLGTLLRTAEAVGVHGVILPHRRTATITPSVVTASSGASEHLLVVQFNLAQAIAALKDNDIWVAGLEGGTEAQTPDQLNLSGPLALVVGNEGKGMRRLVRDSCDLLMRLPMRGQVESLNAAAAGSIALYLAWSARGYDK